VAKPVPKALRKAAAAAATGGAGGSSVAEVAHADGGEPQPLGSGGSVAEG